MKEYLVMKALDQRLAVVDYDTYILLDHVPEMVTQVSNSDRVKPSSRVLLKAHILGYVRELTEDGREPGKHSSRVTRVKSKRTMGAFNVSPFSDGTIIKTVTDTGALDAFFSLQWEVPEDEVY